ncbi:hypothetical protein M378DRAFT_859774 [Amanita muscaria Koide BX008]|uniref:Uncharacterized protein n=1 Tax=Amanita muscaria (strain Koide BX008) TaxID=946122 RepID=A0A0C2SDY9_AMAMK|nr:hypothetical protein M378DRAFT_859774 [Amanita muscaria Koide BX008]
MGRTDGSSFPYCAPPFLLSRQAVSIGVNQDSSSNRYFRETDEISLTRTTSTKGTYLSACPRHAWVLWPECGELTERSARAGGNSILV